MRPDVWHQAAVEESASPQESKHSGRSGNDFIEVGCEVNETRVKVRKGSSANILGRERVFNSPIFPRNTACVQGLRATSSDYMQGKKCSLGVTPTLQPAQLPLK